MQTVFQKMVDLFREEEIVANKLLSEASWNIPLLRQFAEKRRGNLSEESIAKNLPQFFNTKHILAPEIMTEGRMPELHGFHLDRYGLLEKSKIVQFKKLEMLENGFYQGIPGCGGIFKGPTSTFFPQEWALETVAQKVIESCEKPYEVKINGKKIIVIGNTREGLEIKSVFEGKLLKTCYLNLKK